MLCAAIVEDDSHDRSLLESYFVKWCQEKGLSHMVRTFADPVLFLEPYLADYQIVFMDIQMPYVGGMEAAKRLRAMDTDVVLIFVTSLAQFAIQGYEVQAFDYVLKPLSYEDFVMKMSRVIHHLRLDSEEPLAVLSTLTGKVKVALRSITYIESDKHHLIYHLAGGEILTVYAKMKDAEAQYASNHFARCNSCYLVNLRHLKKIQGYTAFLEDGTTLQISQPRKKEFQQEFLIYTEERTR